MKITFLLSIILVSCTKKTSEIYYCPMHLEVTSDKLGQICPKCKMMLVLKELNNSSNQIDSIDVNDLLEPTNEKVIASLLLTKAEKKTISSTLKCNGVIAYDPQNFRSISSLFAGRIEKLYLKYPFQTIQKGDKLFDVYSPEMVTEQQNLIFMLNSQPIERRLVEATKEKLRLLGMEVKQIDELIKTKTVKKNFTVYSQYSGYLLGQDISNTQVDEKSKMGSSNSNLSNDQGIGFKEGAYIEKGQTIFKIANNQRVWVVLKIHEKDIQLITNKLNTDVFIEESKMLPFKGTIDFIEPFNNKNAKTFNIRVYLNNEKQKLKIGQLVNAIIFLKPETGLWIPKSAVIDLGMNKVVFVKENQILHAMIIETGAEINNWIKVISGIDEETIFASNANYLIDSESFIIHKKH